MRNNQKDELYTMDKLTVVALGIGVIFMLIILK